MTHSDIILKGVDSMEWEIDHEMHKDLLDLIQEQFEQEMMKLFDKYDYFKSYLYLSMNIM